MAKYRQQELQNKSIDELKEEAERKRLINEINHGNNGSTPNVELKIKLHSMKIWSIVSIVTCFFLFEFILCFIFNITYGIQILSTDWKNEEVNRGKIVWGIFCFVFLEVISSLIFASINESKY